MPIKSRKCPQCGFCLGLSSRRLLKLYQQEFGSLPVMEMIDRGWLWSWLGNSPNKADIPAIENAILGFFGVKNENELWELLADISKSIRVNGVSMVCNIEPDRPSDNELAKFERTNY